MRKLLLGLLVLIGLTVPTQRASAWYYSNCVPWPQTAAFPAMNPPGWYSNTYYYAWQYPWFAYYNYSHGPYANWMSGGGYAFYQNLGPYPMTYAVLTPPVVAVPSSASTASTITITLPTEATLLFNGTVAKGTGSIRMYNTPPLQPGVDYAYDLTAEVMRGGKVERITKRVVVRAGEKSAVTLTTPAGTR